MDVFSPMAPLTRQASISQYSTTHNNVNTTRIPFSKITDHGHANPSHTYMVDIYVMGANGFELQMSSRDDGVSDTAKITTPKITTPKIATPVINRKPSENGVNPSLSLVASSANSHPYISNQVFHHF